MNALHRIVAVVAIGLVLLGASPGAVEAGLVAWYKLDETSGTTATDSSVSGYHGSLQNFPADNSQWVSGLIGPRALNFDGGNDNVTLTTAGNLGIQGNFTASAWVRPDALGGDKSVFGTDQTGTNVGLHLIIRGTKALMGFYANDTGGNRDLTAGQWQQITWRFNNGEQAIFVNGVRDNATGGHANFAGNDIVRLGRWGGGNYFDGRMDEARIYNNARTDGEIEASYRAAGGYAETFESAGGALPAPWYTSSGMNAIRPRSKDGADGTYGVETDGGTGSPTVTLNVYASTQNDNTGMAWGPVLKVLDATASLQFKIVGGNYALNPGSQRSGGVGLALWDLGTNDFVPGKFVTRSSSTNSYELRSISLSGLAGHMVMPVLYDRQTGSWAWTGVDSLTVPLGAVREEVPQYHHNVLLDYHFDRPGDFMGWQQIDGSGNPIPITSFYIGGFLVNRHINLDGVFDAAEGFVSSGFGNTPTGTLRSPRFTVGGNVFEFYLSGGMTNVAFELWVDLLGTNTFTQVASAAHQTDANEFDYDFWRIQPGWVGKSGYFLLVDNNPGGWGHIHLDGLRMLEFNTPEPSTLTLCGLGVLGLLRRRRQK
jgi:hypothetical protein